MKIVWLCHFNNLFISNKLGLKETVEFAPWISRFIEIFESKNQLDIEIVCPNKYITSIKEFSKGNIKYHFFPFTLPFIPNYFSNFIHYKTNFIIIKCIIKRIITRINPDLIHVFGTENAYFTSSILQLKHKFPVFITIQGFAYFLQLNDYKTKKRKAIEKKIIQEFYHFGIRDNNMKAFIKSVNPDAVFFHHEIAPYLPKYDGNLFNKIFDVVFFASVVKEKGIEDLIHSIHIVKKGKPDIRVCIIGPSPMGYDQITKLIKDLELLDNFTIMGAQKSIDEVHKIAVQARISVLPTHADTIPGTIIESMYMRIPCISYAVGGIPSINEFNEVIKILQKGDIQGLAKNILFLLENEQYAMEMSDSAYLYVCNRWNSDEIYNSISIAYRKILKY
ncbi:MAG: glycosyltransferase family 4 protein [Bacteroidales bacterium]|nr:glycosyltransferase family 4 protein [Bacteroidales bacterium]